MQYSPENLTKYRPVTDIILPNDGVFYFGLAWKALSILRWITNFKTMRCIVFCIFVFCQRVIFYKFFAQISPENFSGAQHNFLYIMQHFYNLVGVRWNYLFPGRGYLKWTQRYCFFERGVWWFRESFAANCYYD